MSTNDEKLLNNILKVVRRSSEYRELVGFLNPLARGIQSSDTAKDLLSLMQLLSRTDSRKVERE